MLEVYAVVSHPLGCQRAYRGGIEDTRYLGFCIFCKGKEKVCLSAFQHCDKILDIK
jgi:hypothetical protein